MQEPASGSPSPLPPSRRDPFEAIRSVVEELARDHDVDPAALSLTTSDLAPAFALADLERLNGADQLLEIADNLFMDRVAQRGSELRDPKVLAGYQVGFVHALRELMALLRERPQRSAELAQTSQRSAVEFVARALLAEQGTFTKAELMDELAAANVLPSESNVSHVLRSLADDGELERVPGRERPRGADRRTAAFRRKAGGQHDVDSTPVQVRDG